MKFARTWTTDQSIAESINRAWMRGEFLRKIALEGEGACLAFKVKGPSTRELTEDFPMARSWAAGLGQGKPYEVIRERVPNRVHGAQMMPTTVRVTVQAALGVLGLPLTVATDYGNLVELIDREAPQLKEWALTNAIKAASLSASFPRLLDVVKWLSANPRPNIYVRQLAVPGVSTKLIETHRSTLTSLLDLSLPEEAIDRTHTGADGFNARYGFKDQPVLVRFRSLDPEIAVIPGIPAADITLDAASFAALDLASVQHVLITENRTNYLTLPQIPGCIAIFGAGYCWNALAGAAWLRTKEVLYWGDIDTHGFNILSQLREHLPHTESVLMDRSTLDACRPLWGREPRQFPVMPPNLTPEEREVFHLLKSSVDYECVRLEQEYIHYPMVERALRLPVF